MPMISVKFPLSVKSHKDVPKWSFLPPAFGKKESKIVQNGRVGTSVPVSVSLTDKKMESVEKERKREMSLTDTLSSE